MTEFTTNIYVCDKLYEANVVGEHHPYERPTLDSPEVQASFAIQQVLIVPNDTVGEINLMTYQYEWLVDTAMLEELENDYFDIVKGEDYE